MVEWQDVWGSTFANGGPLSAEYRNAHPALFAIESVAIVVMGATLMLVLVLVCAHCCFPQEPLRWHPRYATSPPRPVSSNMGRHIDHHDSAAKTGCTVSLSFSLGVPDYSRGHYDTMHTAHMYASNINAAVESAAANGEYETAANIQACGQNKVDTFMMDASNDPTIHPGTVVTTNPYVVQQMRQ